jgi:antitoxin component of RelBE/YafQ-DinJ toxin-antitoxin module
MANSPFIHFRIDQRLKAKLQALAKKEGHSLSSFMKLLVLKYLNK